MLSGFCLIGVWRRFFLATYIFSSQPYHHTRRRCRNRAGESIDDAIEWNRKRMDSSQTSEKKLPEVLRPLASIRIRLE